MINIVYTLQIKATSTRVEHSESGRIRIIFYNSDPQQNMDPDPESDLAFENMTKRAGPLSTGIVLMKERHKLHVSRRIWWSLDTVVDFIEKL